MKIGPDECFVSKKMGVGQMRRLSVWINVVMNCRPGSGTELATDRPVTAGPTTSIREKPYQTGIIERCGIRAVIGKGWDGSQDSEGATGARLRVPARDQWRCTGIRPESPARTPCPPRAVRKP